MATKAFTKKKHSNFFKGNLRVIRLILSMVSFLANVIYTENEWMNNIVRASLVLQKKTVNKSCTKETASDMLSHAVHL